MNIEEVLERELTALQRAVVVDPARWILALACAGSGKTTTFAFRIAYLIAKGADPRGIVAFTFTENAAEAIKLRVSQALAACGLDPKLVGAMFIGTIHGYCQAVLSAMDARYRQFDVVDENALRLFLMSRYPQLQLQVLRPRAPLNSFFATINETASAWTTMNDEMVDLAAVEAADAQLGRSLRLISEALDRDHFIDFSSMIRKVVEALESHHVGAEAAVAEVEHVLCDEYQDVNPAQERLLAAFEARGVMQMVVGDDDQAVFAWRGADVSNILSYEVRHPGCSVHRLSENFRSTDAIVEAADAFASAQLGASREPKHPRAVANASPRAFKRWWFTGPDARSDEADAVADAIAALRGTGYRERDGTERGLTLADFAILMRSTRRPEKDDAPRHAPFTRALEARGIHYTLEAGGSIFDRPQVAVMRDAFGLLREGSPDRDAARAFFNERVLPAYPAADFAAFTVVLTAWGRLLHGDEVRRRVFPQQLLHDLLEAFGIARSAPGEDAMRALGVFSRILQDVEAVYVSIDSAQRFGMICSFLSNVAERGYDASARDVLRRPDAVTVSTVHAVKGLEFPVVFVVDLEQGRFPLARRAYDGWLPAEVIGPALARGAYRTTADEEARLFYVALTRAERYLFVTGSERLPGMDPTIRPRSQSPYFRALRQAEISSDAALPDDLEPMAESRRIDETVLPTSFSEIRYYLRCPADYYFRSILGFSPPIVEMFGYGRTVHASVGKLHERFPDRAPSGDDAEETARTMFHLKHAFPSKDPMRPGPYERARDSAAGIVRRYVEAYGDDFEHRRELERRFEVPLQRAVISGSIDLLLHLDAEGNVLDSTVIDFKAIEGGSDPVTNERLDWTELSLQVQLYANGAREVLGENARSGSVHLLADGKRVEVPVDDAAVAAAIANVEWAVDGVVAGDFPMRPEPRKCAECDFFKLCPKIPQPFTRTAVPPPIHLPNGGREMARAFSRFVAGGVDPA